MKRLSERCKRRAYFGDQQDAKPNDGEKDHEHGSYSYEELQQDLADTIDAAEDEQQGGSIFRRTVAAPDGNKRQKVEMQAGPAILTRRSLKESLIAEAAELRCKQGRRLEDHPTAPGSERLTQKRIRLQGNDAITRLINIGRQEGVQRGESSLTCSVRD